MKHQVRMMITVLVLGMLLPLSAEKKEDKAAKDSDKPVAMVQYMKGKAEFKRADKKSWEKLVLKTKIQMVDISSIIKRIIIFFYIFNVFPFSVKSSL